MEISMNIKAITKDIASKTKENRNKMRLITGTGIVDYDFCNEETGLVNCVRETCILNADIKKMLAKEDGIEMHSKISAHSFMKDEQDAVLKTIKGVCKSETKPDGRKEGLLNFDSNPTCATTGFFVDLNAKGSFARAKCPSNEPKKLLYKNKENSLSLDRLLSAIGIAWGDENPDHMYLRVETSLFGAMKEEKLIDEKDMVSEGNVKFFKMCNGKFRIFYDRPPFRISSPLVRPESTEITVAIMPGAISFDQLWVDDPVGITAQKDSKFDICHRYGFGVRPKGYRWTGRVRPENEDFRNGGYWNRQFDGFSPRILPIFHS